MNLKFGGTRREIGRIFKFTAPVGFCRIPGDACVRVIYSLSGEAMTIAFTLRAAGLAAAVAAAPLLFSPQLLSAQEQLATPSTSRQIGAPVGHRQPRAADVPPSEKSAAEQLEERQQAELNRKLRICRGC
jgi:hypothetical protein